MKFYSTPETLPLYNWLKIQETNDFRYLLKLSDYDILPDKYNVIRLTKAYQELLYKMPSNSFDLEIVRKTNNVLQLESLAVSDGGRFLTTSKIERKKLERLIEEKSQITKKSDNIYDEINNIEQILGLKNNIDIYTCSVIKYISYRTQASNKNKENERLRQKQLAKSSKGSR